jgi:hypothetical protein
VSSDRIEPRSEEPWKHPYTRARTLVNNLAEQRQIAWIDAPIWLPVGSVIELGPPNRDAVVIGTRLQLGPDDDAIILVDVHDPEGAEFIPRHPADRIEPS